MAFGRTFEWRLRIKDKVEIMNARLILLLCISGLAVLFVTQNVSVVEVTFFFWTVSMSRALLIFFTLAIGLVIGWFLHSYMTYRREKKEFSDESPDP